MENVFLLIRFCISSAFVYISYRYLLPQVINGLVKKECEYYFRGNTKNRIVKGEQAIKSALFYLFLIALFTISFVDAAMTVVSII